MRYSRLAAAAGLAALALPATAQNRPRPDAPPPKAERADTVEFRMGRRIQIVRTPGSDRQQRIVIHRDGDTTDVRLDINPEAAERLMRRILVLDDDTTEAERGADDPPVRIRMRTGRGDRPAVEERIIERRFPDGRVVRDTLRRGVPPGLDEDIDMADEAPERSVDGAVRATRPSRLWVERIRDGERPGEEVEIVRERGPEGVATREEDVRVTRDGATVRIERNGRPTTVRPRRTPERRPDGTLVVPDGAGGIWIYVPPRQ